MKNIVRKALCAILLLGCSGLTTQAWAAAFAVTVQSPSVDQLVGDTLTISASSDSLYAITSGTASIANGTQTSGTASGSQWNGTVSLLGAPRGARTLTVTLTDSSGAMASNSVAVTLDRPPSVVVNQPLAWAPVHSPFSIQATCTDDDPGGCAHLRFSGSGFAGVDAKDQLNANVLFSMLDSAATLKFEGEDVAGQTTEVDVPVYVLSSPYLRFIGQGASGSVLDFDGSRLLLNQNGKVWIRRLATGVETTVYENANTIVSSASLTVTGAVLLVQPAPGQPAGPAHVLKWDGAQITDLNAQYFQTNGTQLALQKSSSVELYDVASGNLITSLSGNIGSLGHPDRLVYYAFQVPNYTVRFLHGATDTPLPGSYFRSPVATAAGDSFAVVTPQGIQNGPTTVFPASGGSEVLCPTTPNYCIFQVSGDYVAYQELTGNAPPVSLRTPAGERHPVSAFAGATTLEAVNSSGEVMMSTGGHRFLARNSGAPVDLGGSLGSVRAFDADWYLLADRTVFKYDFTSAAGGATNNGGAAGNGSGGNTGGATDSGGANSAGGAVASGGTNTGGAPTNGGAISAGGSVASAGGVANGGATSAGGALLSTGAQGSNPASNSGGSRSGGGSPASSGAGSNGGKSGCAIAATPSMHPNRGWGTLLTVGLMLGTRLRRKSRPRQAEPIAPCHSTTPDA